MEAKQYYPLGKYGLHHKGQIVYIHSWSVINDDESPEGFVQDLYFNLYRKMKFSFKEDFIVFDNSRKVLRKKRRDSKLDVFHRVLTWIETKTKERTFKKRWPGVEESEMAMDIERLSVLHPLTAKEYKVVSVIKNIDHWYLLENNYVCNCNSNTGYPRIDKPFLAGEMFFKSVDNCWVSRYLKDRRELLDE